MAIRLLIGNNKKITMLQKDKLTIKVFSTREEMGKQAAKDVVDKLERLLCVKPYISMLFAAAPSQNEFLQELCESNSVDWSRVNAYHLDEYIGLPANSPQRFAEFLNENLFSKLPFRTINYLNAESRNPEAECDRYAKLIQETPIDVACIGIGENGHIAFNDPHVANFDDPELVKIVDLDETCRQQQVNDKCFNSLPEVPKQAYTLTVPAIMASDYIYCIVPGESKAEAVKNTIHGEIEEKCPASVLRTKSESYLYLDKESARKLNLKEL